MQYREENSNTVRIEFFILVIIFLIELPFVNTHQLGDESLQLQFFFGQLLAKHCQYHPRIHFYLNFIADVLGIFGRFPHLLHPYREFFSERLQRSFAISANSNTTSICESRISFLFHLITIFSQLIDS